MSLGGNGRRQQWLPIPRRNDSLWRACYWAINADYARGAAADYGPAYKVLRDDITRNKGYLDGGPSYDLTRTYDAGRFVCPGALVDTSIVWGEPNNLWHWSTNCVTMACLMRFNALPSGDSRIIGKLWHTPDLGGIKIVYAPSLGNHFKLGWSDGVDYDLVQSTTVPTTHQTYLLVGRFSTNPVRAELWVNGVLEASKNGGRNCIASNATIRMFLDPTDSPVVPVLNAKIAMAGLWGRTLSTSEVTRLNTNPYAMWIPQTTPKGWFMGGGNGPHCQCCPGWLGSFHDM